MDNTTPTLADRFPSTPNSVNGSVRRPSPAPCVSPVGGGRPASLMDHNSHTQPQAHVVRVVVNRDERGYGMKVSGDNPVYVQSVKEGGAAEKAGLHAGDKIIKVNGENVMSSTHTHVVQLIKSSSQVVLTVQQRSSRASIGSPSLHNRSVSTTPVSTRITGPQPVDHEKQYQLQLEKEQYYRLMIEKERNYVDQLRSQIASSPDEKKCSELAKTERNLQTLQAMLLRSQSEQSSPSDASLHFTSLPSPVSPRRLKHSTTPTKPSPASTNGNSEPPPPPLPKRNAHMAVRHKDRLNNKRGVPSPKGRPLTLDINTHFINNEINANNAPEGVPPPLPPRAASHSAPPLTDPEAVNSINKQMSYPLVATCATLVNDYSPNPTHHRTKSSPESLLVLSGTDPCKRLSASESMNDLSRQEGWENPETPPGTPPPPYPSPLPQRRDRNSNNTDEADLAYDEPMIDGTTPDSSPFRGNNNGSVRLIANSSPIHAATPQTTQQPIISMEDDEISDQESGSLEDHGHFKSLAKLWDHLPHLAVFTNYVLCNSDPNSLMFYLLTDLYKEGNAKEMRKWAFEIHSCFLVPGAPLRLSNVDENIAREIDDVLTREFDKEEILRKIFWKARYKAKEELTRQLTEFQQKRTAGLGTIFGPPDQTLNEMYNDKIREIKLYESLFLEKLEPLLDEVEKENYDPKRYYTAAALTTVVQRVFNVRPVAHALDRCPTFVSKEKSFRTKFIGRYSRKLNIQGHQFVAQQYYTVIVCNNCHQIIYGIGPQGYQCSACLINLHRQCVKLYDDMCPGPINKKDRGLGKFIRMRHENNDHRRKQSSHFIQMEKERRQAEDRDSSFDFSESGEVKTGQPVSRSGSDRRPDAVREEAQRHHQEMAGSMDASSHDVHPDKDETATPDSSVSLPATGSKRKTGSSINRSESVKEQSEKRKQRRNISDPSHNMSGDVDLEHHPQVLSNTDSGSSSNSSISCNGRLSESPSNSVDTVQLGHPHVGSDFDSDMEVETEPLNWQELVPEDELRSLPPHEKKRQDVIHELFHTEASHVRSLKVLYKIFYKKLHESQLLKQEELNLIFPNIKEMLDIHTDFNKEMRRRRKEVPVVKEIGDILTSRFCGPQGEHFQRAAATCFKRQQLALEFIVDRRKKDQKFEAILKECEKKRQCRRLQFQAILPAEMQRLSKYPLLFERLISSVENIKDGEQHQELDMLHQAHHKSKEILDFANEAARDAHNHASLEKIQNHLDTTNFREKADQGMVNEFCDITKHRLILEGDMQLRRPNKAPVVVRILLLEEAVVILHKEGDRFLLKFFQSGSPAQPQPLSPIIKINTLIVRKNAAFKNSLYLVNISTNNSQMYDLSAEDDSKRDMWYKHITDAKEAYDRRDCRKDYSDNETVQELPVAGEVPSARADTVGGESENSDRDTPTRTDSEEVPGGDDADVQRTSEPEGDGTESPDLIAGGGAQPRRVTAEDWPLVQPSQVSIEVPPVHTAESMLTPLEQIRRKDAEVQQALADKEELVADLLSIPRDQFHHIADMASMDTSTGRDLKEYVLAALYQVSQLQKLVNESLNVTERELITAKGGKHPVCASQMPSLDERLTEPSIPAHNVRDIATSLNDHLTTLLSEVKQVEDERTMLRKELHKMRERLHEQVNLHSPTPDVDCCDDLTMAVPAESAPVDVEHCDLENPQHNQEENKKDS